MEYLGSQELRETIQGALNKTEAFKVLPNGLVLPNTGIIQNNNREEQRETQEKTHT